MSTEVRLIKAALIALVNLRPESTLQPCDGPWGTIAANDEAHTRWVPKQLQLKCERLCD